jgi:alpha-glucosidase
MLGLPGSAYLYQGDELGLPEVDDLALSKLEDPTWARSGHTRKGRDGCRVPLPWSRSGSSFGFGDGGSWLPQPPYWGSLSVEAQEGIAGSTLELYREAIRLRKGHLAGIEAFDWVDAGEDMLAFDRGPIRVMVNFGSDQAALSHGEILMASAELDGGLPPDSAVWIRR